MMFTQLSVLQGKIKAMLHVMDRNIYHLFFCLSLMGEEKEDNSKKYIIFKSSI